MIEVIWDMAQEFVITILTVFKKNFRLIMSLMFLALSILFICMIESKVDVVSALLILYFVTELLKHASRVAEKKKDEFPVSKIRYTKIDEDGNPYVEKHNWPMAVYYLKVIEDYATRHGYLKHILILFTFLFLFPCNVQAKELSVVQALSTEEQLLLQQIALAEAESEGVGGMCFVMQVVLNRVESDEFPDTIYEVISEEGQFAAYEKSTGREPTNNSKTALELLNVLQNRGQLYFENDYGKESTWHNRNLTFVFEHFNHKFYM